MSRNDLPHTSGQNKYRTAIIKVFKSENSVLAYYCNLSTVSVSSCTTVQVDTYLDTVGCNNNHGICAK